MTAHHVDRHLGDMNSCTGHSEYEIRVAGRLAPRWAAFFEGMTLTPQDDGSTVVSGPVADQSALHGMLRRLSDLGLPLISVTPTTTPRNRNTT